MWLTLFSTGSGASPSMLASESLLGASGAALVTCYCAGICLICVYIKNRYIRETTNAFPELIISIDREDTDIWPFFG